MHSLLVIFLPLVWAACALSAEEGSVVLISHLEAADKEKLQEKYFIIANNPLNHTVHDVFFARKGIAALGEDPPCNCEALQGISKSQISNGMDLFYRNHIISACDCMMNVVLNSIRMQFNEQDDDISSESDLIKTPDEEKNLNHMLPWMLSEDSVTNRQQFDSAVNILFALMQDDGSFKSSKGATESDFKNTLEVLFVLSMRDKRVSMIGKAVPQLLDVLSTKLFPVSCSRTVASNAHMYRLFIESYPAKPTDSNRRILEIVARTLLDYVRYSQDIRIEVEALQSLNYVEKTLLGSYDVVPLHFVVNEVDVLDGAESVNLVISTYTWKGDLFSGFHSVEVLSLSHLVDGRETTVSVVRRRNVSCSAERKISIPIDLPSLAGGKYAVLIKFNPKPDGDDSRSKILPRIEFVVPTDFQLGSIRIGKTQTKTPKTADLILLHQQKNQLGPGDVSFTMVSNLEERSGPPYMHIRFSIFSSLPGSPSNVLLSMEPSTNYSDTELAERQPITPILLAIKRPKSKGSKNKEYLYDLSVDVNELYVKSPEYFPVAGTYALVLHVDDSFSTKPRSRELGVVKIVLPQVVMKHKTTTKLYSRALLHESDQSMGPLPELNHVFRADDPRAEKWKYTLFTFLIVTASDLGYFLFIKLIVKSVVRMDFSFSAPLFVSLLLMMIVFCCYWIGYESFEFKATMTYIAVIGSISLIFGTRLCLSAKHEMPKQSIGSSGEVDDRDHEK